MKLQDINAINNMRLKGYSVSTISKVLGMPSITPLNHTYAAIQIYREQAYACNAENPLNNREGAKRKSSAQIGAE